MNIPTISGVIRRRLLLNYRIDPEIVTPLLPKGFRPKLVQGYAIAGICLIRLEKVRPKGLPEFLGIASENSAHRIAVEWENDQEGVFVPRRDTDSRLNTLAGGRIFPGVHHLSDFSVSDTEGEIGIKARHKGETPLEVTAKEADKLPDNSIFGSLTESSAFFEAGCIGYSARPDSCVLDGLLLKVDDWQASALAVSRIRSLYFDDHSLFPEGSITFDHGLLMRDIAHEWHSEPKIRP
ncbi:MAG: DUF2071 domain-containing protein [Akkermansiaceae bacterium]